MPVQKNAHLSRQPLFLQVRQKIVSGIESGEWSDGEILPSEMELAVRFGVSQGTVRRGLDSLVADSVLVRRQGAGTFVADTQDDWGRAELPGGVQSLACSIELLACARANAGEVEATALGLRRAASIFVIRRLARVAGEPFAMMESCVSAERFDGLDARRIKQADGNLRRVWLKDFGLRVVSNPPHLRAARAGREEARTLGVENETPLLEVFRAASGMDGTIVEWSILRCRTDHYAYSA